VGALERWDVVGERAVGQKYRLLKGHLDERSLRVWAAAEASVEGHGAVVAVSRATGSPGRGSIVALWIWRPRRLGAGGCADRALIAGGLRRRPARQLPLAQMRSQQPIALSDLGLIDHNPYLLPPPKGPSTHDPREQHQMTR
jgi:hypothetical protein